MSNRLAVCAAFIALCSGQTAGAQEALRVCLNEDLPPLSLHHRGATDSGFDVALAKAVAQKLGRRLEIQWFESKLDEDSSLAQVRRNGDRVPLLPSTHVARHIRT